VQVSRVLTVVTLLLLVWLPAVTNCQTEEVKRIAIPDDLFYYRPAASVFGAEAAWINPASLGRFKTPSLQLMADYTQGEYGKSWGIVTSHDRSAVAYRKIHNPSGTEYREWLWAAGFSLSPGIGLGFSYRYFDKGPGIYNNRHFWNVGLSGSTRGPFSWAAVFSNLNRGKVNGERTETEQRYSLAYRPFGPRLTLAVDMFLSTKTRLSNADYIYHGEFIPVPGLYVYAGIDSDKNFQVGARANLLKYFVGHQSHFDKNGHGGRTTVFVGSTTRRQPSLLPEPRRRLLLGVAGRPAENPPRPIIGRKRTPFANLVLNIYRAADDPSIGEMLLSLNGLTLGFGQAQELREAVRCFRSHGKEVICYLSSPNNVSYYVASIADQILIPPVSQLRLVGLRAELTFYAGTLSKLGVDVELLRVGEHKTAAEKYTRTASSAENRQQINRLLDDLYGQFVQAIAEGRGLSVDSVISLIDGGPFTSTEALAFDLVDGLTYRDELVEEYLNRMPEVSFRHYLADTLLNDDWQPVPKIAVVVAEGEITSGRGSSPLTSSDKLTPSLLGKALSRVRNNPDVKGIILRVNSPGGWALASEHIFRQAARTSEKKPFIVSMSNVAASGGYYISMSAERIFADPATITGSIGIYGGKADLSGLYDKIDLGKELYTRGKFAGMLSTVRPFTEDERIKYQSHLQAFYDHFIGLVAGNRRLEIDSVDALSRGQVWTGREAYANGLIDEIGGLRQSVEHLADALGLEDYRIVIYPEKRPLFVLPIPGLLRAAVGLFNSDSPVQAVLGYDSDASEDDYVLARLPFDIEIE